MPDPTSPEWQREALRALGYKESDPTAPERTTVPCCDLHNAHCEPPGDLCCHDCTEATHPEHPSGVRCVLAAPERTPPVDPTAPVTADDLRDQIAEAINTCMQAGLASSTGTTPHDHADAVLRALESHEVMADVADALSYVIENSEHDTTRFERAHRVLFPNWPKESEDD